MDNPITYLQEFIQWCHTKKEDFWEVVRLYKEQILRTDDPQWDNNVPQDVSVQPYVVNYKNRRHIYIYSKSPWPIVMQDVSGEYSTTLHPRTWTNVDFPNGTRLQAINPQAGMAVGIRVKCTDEMYVGIRNPSYLKAAIASNGTFVIKNGPGFFHSFVIGQPGSGWVVSFYDNTTGTGTPFSVQTLINTDSGITYDTWFDNGLTVVTSGTTPGNITITWY